MPFARRSSGGSGTLGAIVGPTGGSGARWPTGACVVTARFVGGASSATCTVEATVIGSLTAPAGFVSAGR